MTGHGTQVLAGVLKDGQAKIVDAWFALLKSGSSSQGGRIREAELQTQVRSVYGLLVEGLASGSDAADDEAFAPLRDSLSDISRSRAIQGFTPTDTANFVFALKEPIFEALNTALAENPAGIAAGTWSASRLLDRLGLMTMEVYQASREEVIGRQSQEIAELSTPVVQLWDGILALPLIGTLDSARTGVVMEKPSPGHRGQGSGHRHHRHHGRSHRGYAGGAAPAQGHRGRPSHGSGLHHLGHPSPDRPDDGSSRGRAERRLQGHPGRRLRAGAEADGRTVTRQKNAPAEEGLR